MFYFGQQYINHPDHRRVGEAFLAAVNPGATTVPLYRYSGDSAGGQALGQGSGGIWFVVEP